MNWAPEDDPLGQVEIGEVCADGEAGQHVDQAQVPPPVRSLHRGTLGPEASDGLVSLETGRQCGPWEVRGKQIWIINIKWKLSEQQWKNNDGHSEECIKEICFQTPNLSKNC